MAHSRRVSSLRLPDPQGSHPHKSRRPGRGRGVDVVRAGVLSSAVGCAVEDIDTANYDLEDRNDGGRYNSVLEGIEGRGSTPTRKSELVMLFLEGGGGVWRTRGLMRARGLAAYALEEPERGHHQRTETTKRTEIRKA